MTSSYIPLACLLLPLAFPWLSFSLPVASHCRFFTFLSLFFGFPLAFLSRFFGFPLAFLRLTCDTKAPVGAGAGGSGAAASRAAARLGGRAGLEASTAAAVPTGDGDRRGLLVLFRGKFVAVE